MPIPAATNRIMACLAMFFIAACSSPTNPTRQVFDGAALRGGDFYGLPFPENLRLDSDDAAGIAHFPNPADLTILNEYKAVFAEHFRGFGTNSAIYIRFNGDLDAASLPTSPADTLLPTSPVRLIDIEPDSPEFGQATPILLRYSEHASQYTPAYVLAALAYPGFPLRPKTTYALLIDDSVRDPRGKPLSPNQNFLDRLNLPDAVGLTTLGIDLADLAAGAIFTTVDPTADFFTVADFLRARPELVTVDPWTPPVTWTYGDGTFCYEYTGRIRLPNFQHGTVPYLTEGGEFRFSDNGTPIVAQTDAVRVTLRLPETYDAEAGMPYVVYSHGTGGDYRSMRSITRQMCARGIATIGADQPLHGDRIVEGDPSFLTFNLINPVAMVHNFQQGGLESIAIAMAMETLSIPAAISPYGETVVMDASRQMFMGHSQGALTGLYTLAADGKNFAGAVLSGSSGGLILALAHKIEPINFPLLLELGLASVGEFDLFHPALTLFQMFGEAADPLNYGRYLVREARPNLPDWRPLHVFQSEGIVDEFTPPPQAEALAATLGVGWVRPALEPVEPLAIAGQTAPAPRPFSGNISHQGQAYTAALIQYPSGHFAVTDDPDAWREFAEFLEDLSARTLPVIRPR